MDDDEAFMLLALSNAQGELDATEVGLHVYRAVTSAKGGRGKKGGIAEYARKIGRSQQYVTRLWEAGAVLDATKSTTHVVDFLGRADHAAALYKLPASCWRAAVTVIWREPNPNTDVCVGFSPTMPLPVTLPERGMAP